MKTNCFKPKLIISILIRIILSIWIIKFSYKLLISEFIKFEIHSYIDHEKDIIHNINKKELVLKRNKCVCVLACVGLCLCLMLSNCCIWIRMSYDLNCLVIDNLSYIVFEVLFYSAVTKYILLKRKILASYFIKRSLKMPFWLQTSYIAKN